MENNRKYKIIDNINGCYYELNTQDEFETYLNDIIQENQKETYYNDIIEEYITYYKRITTITNHYTMEENTDFMCY
jgi:lipopolysaccharide biosynthesis regulator YciM